MRPGRPRKSNVLRYPGGQVVWAHNYRVRAIMQALDDKKRAQFMDPRTNSAAGKLRLAETEERGTGITKIEWLAGEAYARVVDAYLRVQGIGKRTAPAANLEGSGGKANERDWDHLTQAQRDKILRAIVEYREMGNHVRELFTSRQTREVIRALDRVFVEDLDPVDDVQLHALRAGLRALAHFFRLTST